MTFDRIAEHIIKEKIMALKYLSFSRKRPKPEKQAMIAMVDGRQYHGGMCDRFKGIVSLYAYCKQRGLGFRILYTYPFQLEDYLLPASYDWTLKDGELDESIKGSRIMYLRGEDGKRLISLRTRKQLHFYGNMDLLEVLNRTGNTSYGWGTLFKELFKPAPELERQLSSLREQIGEKYNAAVFRFQNLLGDFPEYRFKPIEDKSERDTLIGKCLQSVRDTLSKAPPGTPLLVTSDSVSFLKMASEINGVFIIPGSLSHMDGSRPEKKDGSHKPYIKSFLDFFMLAGAQKVSCIGTSIMYQSEFPMYAAKINDVPFERIRIE